MRKDYPILEFDQDRDAIISPQALLDPVPEMPPHCVICFFQDVINHMLAEQQLTEIAASNSEMGKHPIYRMEIEGKSVGLFHPGIGAPLAGSMLDEVIAQGNDEFEKIAQKHSKTSLNIPPYMYDLWLECLITTVKQEDEQFSDDVELAWRTMMAPSVAFMKHYYEKS